MRRSRAKGRLTQREPVARFVEDLDELKGIVALLQSQGKVVVFATGSFDLLHVGHVRCLKDARSRGDFLVIGVQSDAVVRESEGAGFPLHRFEERAELVGAFGFVDYITRVDEASARKVIEALNPTVYAVGSYQKLKSTEDHEEIKEQGCNVVFVGGGESRSTRDTLSKIWALNTPKAREDLAMKEVSGSGKAKRKRTSAKKPTTRTGTATTKATKKATGKKAAAKKATVKKTKTSSKSAGSRAAGKKTTTKARAAAKKSPAGKGTATKKSTRSTAGSTRKATGAKTRATKATTRSGPQTKAKTGKTKKSKDGRRKTTAR